MKKVLGCMRRACEEFDMIRAGDKIAIGVSGGKDSMLLAKALSLYKQYLCPQLELLAITVDLGFEGFNTDIIRGYLSTLGIPLHVCETNIGEVVFDLRKEKNPCALCAKMRKGSFYERAVSLGCNKAAYAHQMEDVIETLLLSLLYESRINTFLPVTYLSRTDMVLIRPFIYLPEKDVINAVCRYDIPVHKNPCPACGKTKREEIKNLINTFQQTNPQIKKCLMAAIKNQATYNLWDKSYRRP